MSRVLRLSGLMLVGLVLCAAPPRVEAQHVPEGTTRLDADTPAAILQTARGLTARRAHTDALPQFERAIDLARRLDDQSVLGEALLGSAEVLNHLARYADARARADAACALATARGDGRLEARAALLLSTVEDLSGNPAAGRTRAERAHVLFEALDDAHGMLKARLLLVRLRPPDQTRDRSELDELARNAAKLGDLDLEGRALHMLGDRLFTFGRYVEALPSLMRASTLFDPEGEPVALGTVYNSIGRVYRAHGRLDAALDWQQRALALHEGAGDTFTLMQSLNAVSAVLQRLGRITEARRYSERALTLAEQTGSDRVEDFLRASLATLLAQDGELERAVRMLEQVVARGHDTQLATRYAQLSGLYTRMGRASDALMAAQQALDRCGDTRDVCLNALANRAAAHDAGGDTTAALADVNTALYQLEALRTESLKADYFRQTFQTAYERLYTSAISLMVRQGDAAGALETAEGSRARALVDLLATRALTLPEPSDASLGAAEVNDPAVRESTTGSEWPPVVLRGRPPSQSVPGPATSPLEARTNAQPASADALIATAARLGSTLLVYWVGDRTTFIWVVRADGTVSVRSVDVLQTRLDALVRATAPSSQAPAARPSPRAIATRGSSAVEFRAQRPGAWRELHALLIEPVRPLLPAEPGALLTIVPHGPLQHLGFAALQSARGRYLLEDFTLHFVPAGALLDYTHLQRRADARTQPVLVVADPVLKTRSELDQPLARLPGARQEARAIGRLLPATQVHILQGDRATEHDVRQRMPGPAVLHFATHAIVRDDDPLASYLALAGSSEQSDGDGLLTAQDVYGLRLDADLVVLSACRSAAGTVAGDGIATLARAFVYAGTATVVASHWDVADEPTNRLLPAFYRAWLAGASKAAALRRAQLALLRDLRNGRVQIVTPVGQVALPEHPAFWAGFAVFGEPD